MKPVELGSYTELFSEYTELRAQENRTLSVAIVNGDVMGNSRSTGSGVSARTFSKGIWGFASNPIIDDESIRKVIK